MKQLAPCHETIYEELSRGSVSDDREQRATCTLNPLDCIAILNNGHNYIDGCSSLNLEELFSAKGILDLTLHIIDGSSK